MSKVQSISHGANQKNSVCATLLGPVRYTVVFHTTLGHMWKLQCRNKGYITARTRDANSTCSYAPTTSWTYTFAWQVNITHFLLAQCTIHSHCVGLRGHAFQMHCLMITTDTNRKSDSWRCTEHRTQMILINKGGMWLHLHSNNPRRLANLTPCYPLFKSLAELWICSTAPSLSRWKSEVNGPCANAHMMLTFIAVHCEPYRHEVARSMSSKEQDLSTCD